MNSDSPEPATPSLDSFARNRPGKLLVFAGTFVLAVLLAAPGIVSEPQLIVFFPLGLFILILGSRATTAGIWLVAGWLIYLAVMIWALATSRPRLVAILYAVFIVLLVANIAGCRRLASH